MKKILLLIQSLLIAFTLQAQVNTTSPLPTSSGGKYITTKVNKGFVPRMDSDKRTKLEPTTTDADKGLQVFDTTTNSFWLWNGTTWVENTVPKNIYNIDNTLAGNRIVTQGNKSLSFTATTTKAFNVNDTIFSVDAANNRVGIGTNTPEVALDVNGRMRIIPIEGKGSDLYRPIGTDDNGVLSANLLDSLKPGESVSYKISGFVVKRGEDTTIKLPEPKDGYTVIAKITLMSVCQENPYSEILYLKREAKNTPNFAFQSTLENSFVKKSNNYIFFVDFNEGYCNSKFTNNSSKLYIRLTGSNNDLLIKHEAQNTVTHGLYVPFGEVTVLRK